MKNQLKATMTFISLLMIASIFTGCEKEDPPEPTKPPPPTQENPNEITEDINSKTVLTDVGDGIDYYVCGGIDVNAELIIEAGVELEMCSGAELNVTKNGSLNAIGTSAKPVVFRGKVATPGYWDLIHINSNNPKNHLEHVMIYDAGGHSTYQNSSVWVNNNNYAQLSMENTTISQSKGYGLVVEEDATLSNFKNNHFSGNGDAGIKIPFPIIGSLDAGTDYSDGNVHNYVEVTENDITNAQTVKALNVPYHIVDPTTIKAGLTLEAGVHFSMGAGSALLIDPTGYMNAIGTATDSIIISGSVDAVGYWRVIHFNSNNPKNEFAFVKLENGGGHDYYNYSTIFINNNDNGYFKMNDCSISDSYGWGIYVENGATASPSTQASMEAANSFSNNGTGTSSNCGVNCNVYFD